MTDKLLAFAWQKVDDRNLDHSLAAGVVFHCGSCGVDYDDDENTDFDKNNKKMPQAPYKGSPVASIQFHFLPNLLAVD